MGFEVNKEAVFLLLAGAFLHTGQEVVMRSDYGKVFHKVWSWRLEHFGEFKHLAVGFFVKKDGDYL